MIADELIVDGQPGRPLTADRYLIGRGEGCDVLLPEADAAVSRRHALLERDARGQWTALDLSSRNGTLVNGVRVVGRQSMRHGDRLQIGSSVLVLNLPPSRPTLVLHAPSQEIDVRPSATEPEHGAHYTGSYGRGNVAHAAGPSAVTAALDGPQAIFAAGPQISGGGSSFLRRAARATAIAAHAGVEQSERHGALDTTFPACGTAAGLIANKVLSDCLASPGLRIGGYIIEAAICLLLSIGALGSISTGALGTAAGVLGLAGLKQSRGGLLEFGGSMVIMSLVSGSLLIAYIVWDFVLMTRGQTPGKKMLGMVVVTGDEMRAGFWTMFLRQVILRGIVFGLVLGAAGAIPVIGAALSVLLALLSGAWLLFDAHRQQWYDKICMTYVIDMHKAEAAYE